LIQTKNYPIIWRQILHTEQQTPLVKEELQNYQQNTQAQSQTSIWQKATRQTNDGKTNTPPYDPNPCIIMITY